MRDLRERSPSSTVKRCLMFDDPLEDNGRGSENGKERQREVKVLKGEGKEGMGERGICGQKVGAGAAAGQDVCMMVYASQKKNRV